MAARRPSCRVQVRTPVLIVHGEDDTNVPVSQAIYFHRPLSRFVVEHDRQLPARGRSIRFNGSLDCQFIVVIFEY